MCGFTSVLKAVTSAKSVVLFALVTKLPLGNASCEAPASRPAPSRSRRIQQLEKGVIPYRKVGTHRRIMFKDLMEYKQTMDRNRLNALEELSAIDQELGLGY